MGNPETNKKQDVMNAALYLITEQGFHATPMSQIAKQSKVSVGNIYHYFPSKEDLINELYTCIKNNLAEYVRTNFSMKSSVSESFHHLYRCVVHYSLTHPLEFYFAEQFENSPLIQGATREEVMRMDSALSELYLKAKEQMELKDLPYETLSYVVYGALTSLIKYFLSDPSKFNEQVLDSALDVICEMYNG